MTERMEELNIRELAGQIDTEIKMAGVFHDIPEELKVGEVRWEPIDTEEIEKMIKNERLGFQNAMDVMMHVLARHCGKVLVNCDEMPVDPLPDKRLERFGPDEDDD